MRRAWCRLLIALVVALESLHASDLSAGVMYAVPTPGGTAPTIDGDLADWDLSGAEPLWISDETAARQNAVIALMYDDQALYLSARVSLGGRPLRNTANAIDAFWGGDLLQFRYAADPALASPLDVNDPTDRIVHVSMWRNTDTEKNWLQYAYGAKFQHGSAIAPAGSALAIRVDGDRAYVIEARLTWAAAHVPGGRNPFAAGQRMGALFDMLWQPGDSGRTSAVYRRNPGTFGFANPSTWGEVEFSPTGHLAARHETLEQVIARLAAKPVAAEVGVPITLTIPEDALKATVVVFGADGEVVRELIGGEARPRGELTVRWDGVDQWGDAMPPGDYRWGAYLSPGVQAQYMGGVGKSASPFYENAAGTGGWGADHSDPIDVAADAGGWYFLWPVAEAGRALVKTDLGGAVVWRRSPFVGGGFGPFFAVASNGRYVFLTLGEGKPSLVRLDAATGQTLTWGDGADASASLDLGGGEPPKPARDATPTGQQPEACGLAASANEVFVPLFSRDCIRVIDAVTGARLRDLPCPGPRGVALSGADCYAISTGSSGARVLRFAGGSGAGVAVVSSGLESPWDVAVDETGAMFVSDCGASQQIKVFAPDGALRATWGDAGGRAWAGRYDASSFLHPAGVAYDGAGGVLIAESSIPKPCSRRDARTGEVLRSWFGAPSYWSGTWPDPKDPWTVYYQLNDGIARARIPTPGGVGLPDAYWNMPRAGFPAVGAFDTTIPTVEVLANGRTYLIGDTHPNGICLVDGDRLLPVGSLAIFNHGRESNPTGPNRAELWSDTNGDHQVQPDEIARIETVDGEPLPAIADWLIHGTHVATNGDIFIETAANRILLIPAIGFAADGAIRWDVTKARFAVPTVLPSLGDAIDAGPRGECGIEVDSAGAIYTCFGANVPTRSADFDARMRQRFPDLEPWQWGAYADARIAARSHEGLGHTSDMNAVKIAKFAADGHPLWIAGRKATTAAKPGEMYHFWALAGLIGDDYIVAASEWGPFYVYTADGFFVDALMANPGLSPPPGPYTFGGETGAGRIRYFKDLDQVWAYSVGSAFRVMGFSKGRIVGERRLGGTLHLDQSVGAASVAAAPTAVPALHIARMRGRSDDDAAWKDVPVATLTREGATLATARLALDDAFLHARIDVTDPTPLVNVADTLNIAFKGGDTAGFTLGASHHDRPAAGDVRILAARIRGRDVLVAMKGVTAQTSRPDTYVTPASGRVEFAFVGEVPGGRVTLVANDDRSGYRAVMSVPRGFIELPLAAGTTLSGDIEVRLSGQGQRGIQATSRNYLFTPQRSETSMVDDVPTEARLYPSFWGTIEVD